MEEVKIGNQIWMKQNLDIITFRNGDYIELAESESDWRRLRKEKKPACYCPGLFQDTNIRGEKFYNWYAILDPRGIAPEGWHIPSVSEWDILADTLGGEDIAADKLKAETEWPGYEETEIINDVEQLTGVYINDGGNNLSGFSAFPTGMIAFGGEYFAWDTHSFFATSDWYEDDYYGQFPIFKFLYNCGTEITTTDHPLDCAGGSIRCVKNI
jgi:uncharacterized protein (TIGR02145 family)